MKFTATHNRSTWGWVDIHGSAPDDAQKIYRVLKLAEHNKRIKYALWGNKDSVLVVPEDAETALAICREEVPKLPPQQKPTKAELNAMLANVGWREDFHADG
jgi:hypothetical protein